MVYHRLDDCQEAFRAAASGSPLSGLNRVLCISAKAKGEAAAQGLSAGMHSLTVDRLPLAEVWAARANHHHASTPAARRRAVV